VTQRRYTLPRGARLSGDVAIRSLLEQGRRESRGPITLVTKPIGGSLSRLAIRTSRAVGTAPRRNRIRRLLREAFRIVRHDLPRGYDVLILVRPHEPLIFADYQRLLSGLLIKAHQRWQTQPPTPAPTAPPPTPPAPDHASRSSPGP
jgi:ribonuclease P protein component